MKVSEFKLCPFCGGDADIIDVDTDADMAGWWAVSCVECEAEIQYHYILYPGENRNEDKIKARAEIVKTWNKRFRGRKWR